MQNRSNLLVDHIFGSVLDPFWMLLTFKFGSRFWPFPISAYYKGAVLSLESYQDGHRVKTHVRRYFVDGGA